VESAARGDWENLYLVASGESTDPDADHALLQSNIVVRALDYGCPSGYSAAQALADIDDVAAQHPRVADVYSWSFSFCLGWDTAASEQRLVTEDLASPPMLVVSSAHDAATPLAGAQNLVTQLNNQSRLLVIEKEGHGVIGTDEDGTRAGIDFVRAGTLEPCTTLDCLGLGNFQLRGFRLPQTHTERRPHLRNRLSPMPIRPLLRVHR
jgi:pimeloyl-ACP methyl ester carboxylesterase